jgi:triacylglycerol lipase
VNSVNSVLRALVRPGTYTGWANEVANTARCAAWYPMGVLDAVISSSEPCGDERRDTPVVLVHGYGHNRSGWLVTQHHLRRAGFTSVHTVNYTPIGRDVPQLAAQLAERIALIRTITGHDRVHVVGHSLGGVLLRWYVQEMEGRDTVATAITVASPHEGTWAAAMAPGRTAAQLRPGSWVMRRLARPVPANPVRWIAFYSNLDALIQPARSAMVTHPDLRATNLLVKDLGHLSAMVSPVVAHSIVHQLEAAEGVPGTAEVLPLVAAAEPLSAETPAPASSTNHLAI